MSGKWGSFTFNLTGENEMSEQELKKILEHLERQSVRIEAKLDELLLAKKKRVVKAAASTKGYGPAFTALWGIYPKRAGGNPIDRAFKAYNKRIKDGNGNEHFLIKYGIERYASFCDATGKTGTEYVMQAATFFGPDKHYENDWTIPDTVRKSAIPRDNDEMLSWAVKRGMRQPHQGESWNQYRAYVEGEA
jgi:hypothetical protein